MSALSQLSVHEFLPNGNFLGHPQRTQNAFCVCVYSILQLFGVVWGRVLCGTVLYDTVQSRDVIFIFTTVQFSPVHFSVDQFIAV